MDQKTITNRQKSRSGGSLGLLCGVLSAQGACGPLPGRFWNSSWTVLGATLDASWKAPTSKALPRRFQELSRGGIGACKTPPTAFQERLRGHRDTSKSSPPASKTSPTRFYLAPNSEISIPHPSEFFSSVEKFEDSASDRYSFAREWKVSNQVNIHYDIIF